MTGSHRKGITAPQIGNEACRSCHHPGAEEAESRCFECHTYHDPAQRKPAHGNFSVAELQGRAR